MGSLNNIRISIFRYVHAFFIPNRSLHSRQKWILGLFNLATVVVFWVLSSFLVNAMVESDEYRKPFFITWINTSCFSLYIIPYLSLQQMSLCQFVSQMGRDWKYDRVQMKDEERLGSPGRYGSDDNLSDEQQQEGQEQQQQQQPHCSHLSCVVSKGSQDLDLDLDLDLDSNSACALDVNTYETFKLSLQFIILWFSANLVTNASLSYTSVASQTILSSTSSFFTLIIGYLVSVEQINKNKVAGILLSFAGVLIVTKVDTASDNPNNGPATSTFLIFIGNSLALVGALIYGVYTILLKLKISTPNSHKERNLNTHLFFGYVGLICLLGLWPILVILHITGVEKFELPQSSLMTEILITNAAITFISDFCWCNAVLLTSPLTVTVGLSMTIPLAMVGDWIFKKFQLNLLYIFGALIVTTGFLIINKDEEEDFVVSE